MIYRLSANPGLPPQWEIQSFFEFNVLLLRLLFLYLLKETFDIRLQEG
jgi:hypothetical protein